MPTLRSDDEDEAPVVRRRSRSRRAALRAHVEPPTAAAFGANNQTRWPTEPTSAPPLLGAVADDWRWRASECDEIRLLDDETERRHVLFHPEWSNGTAGARADRPLPTSGRAYWEVRVANRLFGTSIMFGVGPASLADYEALFTDLLGRDAQSWAMSHKGVLMHAGEKRAFADAFRENTPTVVGVLFDGAAGTLSFYKDGKSLGVAFDNLQDARSPLYPWIASTAARSEFQLGRRFRSVCPLFHLCLSNIAQSLPAAAAAQLLPLPQPIKQRIAALVADKCHAE